MSGMGSPRPVGAVAATAAAIGLVSGCGTTDVAQKGATERPVAQTAAAPSTTPRAAGRLVGTPLVMRGAEGRLVIVFRSRAQFAKRQDDGAVIPGTLRIGDGASGRYQGYDGYLGALSRGTGSTTCYLWTITATPRLQATPSGQATRYSLRFPDGTLDAGDTVIGSAPPPAQLDRTLGRIGCTPVTGERARTLRALLKR